jgi:hypothetical protein
MRALTVDEISAVGGAGQISDSFDEGVSVGEDAGNVVHLIVILAACAAFALA